MISPRIMLPPSNLANAGDFKRVGMVVPSHWSGDFYENGPLWPTGTLAIGAAKYSDKIIVAGFNTFAVYVPFGTLADPETVAVYFRLWCRSTGDWITADPVSQPTLTYANSPLLGSVAAFESRNAPLVLSVNGSLVSDGRGQVFDVIQLVLVNDGANPQLLYTNKMFMMCGVA